VVVVVLCWSNMGDVHVWRLRAIAYVGLAKVI